MNDPVTLPNPQEIADRISACREELTELKRLQRLARAARAAHAARDRRQMGRPAEGETEQRASLP
jgi:hypothetical protein